MAAHNDPNQTADIPAAEDSLDAGLEAGFGPDSVPPLSASESRLARLRASVGATADVLLRDPDSGSREPVVQPRPLELPAGGAGRYQVAGQIARGGMGAVLRARDTDLGRDLALKVLLDKHRHRPEVVRRFLEEAQISGQLQHPGITPVHELGVLADGRPFFAMKLVKGRTLAALLAGRAEPRAELPKFLGLFLQVCQTVAYAHARGVIHRDLKPANVMVGAFGEVLVMDWGLAKVLAQGGVADEAQASRGRQPPEAQSVIRTARSGTDGSGAGSDTQAGSVLGTPSYMAPEQARGDVDLVDERADVFGLGAILCEVLTGQPPFTGRGAEAQRKAQAGRVDDAHARLDGWGADAELVALAKHCLAAEPWDRPRDAQVVANAVGGYLNGVQERLHRAELERTAAEARADAEARERAAAEGQARAERRSRRVQLALAASVLLLAGLGGGGAWWVQAHRAEQAQQAAALERDVEAALAEAEAHRDAGRWPEAQAALQRAEGRLGGGGPAGLRERARQAAADLAMVAELDEVRMRRNHIADTQRSAAAREAYAAAFRRYGIDVAALGPADAGARVAASGIRDALVLGVDDWVRHLDAADAPARDRLAAVVDRADDDPWRRQFRAAARAKDGKGLAELAGRPEVLAQSPATLVALGAALRELHRDPEAVALLRRAQFLHPDDVWINCDLGFILITMHPRRTDETLGYYRAALARRPTSPGIHNGIGGVLANAKDVDGAIAYCRRAIELDPNYVPAHTNLGVFLFDYRKDADGAIACFRRALELDPKYALAHANLGNVLRKQNDLDGALACLRRALELNPKLASAHEMLGRVLRDRKDLDGALASFRRAAELDPYRASVHSLVGYTLQETGNLDGALASFRRAVEIDPADAMHQTNLGHALAEKGDLDGALAAHRRALALDPNLAMAHNNLGAALVRKKDRNGAIASYRRALELDPKLLIALRNLGTNLLETGDWDGAIACGRRALELDPRNPVAHNDLGVALREKKDVDGAIASFRRAVELDPNYVKSLVSLGALLHARKEYDEALACFRRALAVDPTDVLVHTNVGIVLRDQKDLPGAVASLRRALELDPKNLKAYRVLAPILAEMKDWDGAIAGYRRVTELAPADAWAYRCLGDALSERRDWAGAVAAYRRSLELDPKQAVTHRGLGRALSALEDLDGAIASYRRALELDPKLLIAQNNLARALSDRLDWEGAVAAYRRSLELSPTDPVTYWRLGHACLQAARFAEAADAFRAGLRLPAAGRGGPDLAAALRRAERLAALDARRAAVLAGADRLAGADERLAFAELLMDRGQPATAVRFYDEALALDPALAETDPNARYNAACCAARAGCGRGADAAGLDDAARADLRRQALAWLRDHLTAWAWCLADGGPAARPRVQNALRHWQRDQDLTGVRGEAALAKLPEAERAEWRKLWADVAALREQAEAAK